MPWRGEAEAGRIRVIWGPLFLCVLVLNFAYLARKIRDDLQVGNRGMALLGGACLLGMNGMVAWMIYVSVASSTDL